MNYKTVKAVRQLFIALIFIMININIELKIGIVNFVPSFIGYYLASLAAVDLFDDGKGQFVKILSLICCVISLVDFILALMRAEVGYWGLALGIADLAFNLILMYMLFHRMSVLAEDEDLPDTAITIRSIMAAYIITYIGNYLTMILFGNGFIIALLGILMYAIILYALLTVFKLAGKLEEKIK